MLLVDRWRPRQNFSQHEYLESNHICKMITEIVGVEVDCAVGRLMVWRRSTRIVTYRNTAEKYQLECLYYGCLFGKQITEELS